MKKETPKNYTNKEVGTALNNAVACTTGTLSETSDARKRQLRHYTSAILDSILKHRKEEFLSAEELVYVLSCAALFVQVSLISKNGVKFPMYEDLAVRIVEDQDSLC